MMVGDLIKSKHLKGKTWLVTSVDPLMAKVEAPTESGWGKSIELDEDAYYIIGRSGE